MHHSFIRISIALWIIHVWHTRTIFTMWVLEATLELSLDQWLLREQLTSEVVLTMCRLFLTFPMTGKQSWHFLDRRQNWYSTQCCDSPPTKPCLCLEPRSEHRGETAARPGKPCRQMEGRGTGVKLSILGKNQVTPNTQIRLLIALPTKGMGVPKWGLSPGPGKGRYKISLQHTVKGWERECGN